MGEIKIEESEVVFNEIRGGTTGTKCFYVVFNGEFIPISSLVWQECEKFVRG